MLTRQILKVISVLFPAGHGFIETDPMDVGSCSRNTAISFILERDIKEDKIKNFKNSPINSDVGIIVEYDGPSPGTPSLLISHSVLSRDYNTSIKKFVDDMEEHARFLLKKGSIRIDIVVGSAVREELVVKHIQDNFFRRASGYV